MIVEYQSKYSLSNWKEDVNALMYSHGMIGDFEMESAAFHDLTDKYWDFKDKLLYNKSVYLRTRNNRNTSENIITLRSYHSLDSSVLHITEVNGGFRLTTAKEILNYLSDDISLNLGDKPNASAFVDILDKHLFNFIEIWNRRATRGIYTKDKEKPEMKKIGSISVDNFVAFSGKKAFHSYELELDIADDSLKDDFINTLSKTLSGTLTEIQETKIQQVVNTLSLF